MTRTKREVDLLFDRLSCDPDAAREEHTARGEHSRSGGHDLKPDTLTVASSILAGGAVLMPRTRALMFAGHRARVQPIPPPGLEPGSLG